MEKRKTPRASVRQAPPAASVHDDDGKLRRRIAERAYDLYLRRACAPGHDVEDWLEAERLLRDEAASSAPRPRRGGRKRPGAQSETGARSAQ